MAQAAPDAGATGQAVLKLGRSLSADFWAGRLQDVWAQMSPRMKELFGGTPAGLTTARTQILELAGGGSGTLLAERVVEMPGAQVYVRTFRGTRGPDAFNETWAIDGQSIVGFRVQPAELKAATSKYLDYVSRTVFRLPVKGTWTVVWGGRTLEQNQHAVLAAQRFALDLLIERQGKSYRTDGKALSDYYCWGEEILAPADGTVVSAVDQFSDRLPSEDTEHPAGNAVVIDHGMGEYTLLAHLRKGSVAVKAGDKIRQGQLVGRCGSTGNASEPHLHLQAMDGPTLFSAESFPMTFVDVVVNGKPVARAELVRGQKVSAGAAP